MLRHGRKTHTPCASRPTANFPEYPLQEALLLRSRVSNYHPGSGDVSSEGEFVAGKRHGKWIWRYPGGKIREEGVYEHGVEVGTWTQYHENGQKLGEGQYIDGKREGEWHWWRENGKTWRTAVYAKGREAK